MEIGIWATFHDYLGVICLNFSQNISSGLICDIPHTVQNLADRVTIVVKLRQCAEKTEFQEPIRAGMHYVCPLVWSVEYLVWSAEYLVWSAEYLVWSVEYLVWSAEYLVWYAEYLVWSAEYLATSRNCTATFCLNNK